MEKEIAIIVAKARNNVIGNKGEIPWFLKPDLKHFREITTGYPIVMGRNTFDSLPKVLPNRLNVVVSNTINMMPAGVLLVRDIKALSYLDTPKIFYIGGSRIYEEAIELCNKLYITQLEDEYEGDTYFPEIDMNEWQLLRRSETFDQEGIKYRFEEYIKA